MQNENRYQISQPSSGTIFVRFLLVVFLGLNSVIQCAFAGAGESVSSAAVVVGQGKTKALLSTFYANIPNMRPRVLQLALQAYNTAVKKGISNSKPILTIIDYSLPSTANRLWVIDLRSERVLFNLMVAHGKGSGENLATNFSDKDGTLASSIGLFLTKNTYFGKHGYSLKIKGLEQGFNGNAEERHIVIHPAEYVSQNTISTLGRLGRSWGCPAIDGAHSKPVIDTIKNGTLVFAYYPQRDWLQNSKFLK